jgi:hypothetical protein
MQEKTPFLPDGHVIKEYFSSCFCGGRTYTIECPPFIVDKGFGKSTQTSYVRCDKCKRNYV